MLTLVMIVASLMFTATGTTGFPKEPIVERSTVCGPTGTLICMDWLETDEEER